MEDKNKQETNDSEDTNSIEEVSKDNNINSENFSDDKDKIQIDSEDVNQILNQLKERFNIEDKNIRIVKIERKKTSTKEIFLNILLSYIFDFVLMVSLIGYFKFAEPKILNLLMFSLIFSSIEYLLKNVIMSYVPKLMFLSLGTILLPLTIISFVIAGLVTPGLNIEGDRVVAFLIIFLVVRMLMRILLMRRSKLFRSIKGGKK